MHLEGALNETELLKKLRLVNIPSSRNYYHERHKEAERIISLATAIDPEWKVLRPLLGTLQKLRGAKQEGQRLTGRERR